MSKYVALQAAARLTPTMAVFQVKRLARNRLVPRFARAYGQRIAAAAARLPLPGKCENIDPSLATFVGAFYRQSDEMLRDATEGTFTFFERTVSFPSVDTIDWSYRLPEEDDHHLWRMKLNQLEVVHSMLAEGDSSLHDAVVELLTCFAGHRDFANKDVFLCGWSPYGTSHRLLAILSGLSLASRRGGISDVVSDCVQSFVRMDAAFLWSNIEHDLRNNHTERNLAALCLYHMACGAIDGKQSRILSRQVRRIIRATVLPDGTQVERSAMYQGLTVMSLKIFAEAPFLSHETRDLARERLDAAMRAWAFLSHEDGGIVLFNDSWLGETPSPADLFGQLPLSPAGDLRDGGYLRLRNGSLSLVMDAGPIGPRWNPGHGHADFLAVEVDSSGLRFIVDPGTSQYSTGPRRSYDRSAASHNGPRYQGVEPIEYAGCFKVGRLRSASPVSANLLDEMVIPTIGGTFDTAVGSCLRLACSLPHGGLLLIDSWSSPEASGLTSFLVPDEWSLATTGHWLVQAHRAGTQTSLHVHKGALSHIDSAVWSSHYMATRVAHHLAFQPARDGGGQQMLAISIGAGDHSDVDVALERFEKAFIGAPKARLGG